MPPKRKTPSLPSQSRKKPCHPPGEDPDNQNDGDTPELIQQTHLFGGTKAKLALDLPPMHNLDDIYAAITSHAMDNGLADFLDHMQQIDRPLRVATVCSGTESPLLALEMVQKCKSIINLFSCQCSTDLCMSGLKNGYIHTFPLAHLFSAEIVPFKQAYIERNFNPPLLFRDVTQLKDEFAYVSFLSSPHFGLTSPLTRLTLQSNGVRIPKKGSQQCRHSHRRFRLRRFLSPQFQKEEARRER